MVVFTVKKSEKFKYTGLTNIKVKLPFEKLGTVRFSQNSHFCKNASADHKSDIICQKNFVEGYYITLP